MQPVTLHDRDAEDKTLRYSSDLPGVPA